MKPTIVISTVGQSVFGNLGNDVRERVRAFEQQLAQDATDRTTVLEAIRSDARGFSGEDIYDFALKTLEARTENDRDWMYRASAELNSLMRILDAREQNNNDVLIFLASDTADGALAGRIISDFAEMFFGRKAELYIVQGLQVTDGAAFRKEGLRNLIRLLYSFLGGDLYPAATYHRVINPTGGFKGVVPYLTIIGMLEQAEISYIYERSPELISLSGLPISLDYDLLKSATDVLEDLSQDALEEEAVKERLGASTQSLSDHPIWPLIELEPIDGENFVALNGLGIIALEHLRDDSGKPVYLSRQASAKLNKAAPSSEDRREWETILTELGKEIIRDANRHTVPNVAKATVYKRRGRSQRAFYLDQGDHILVLEFAKHINESEYDTYPQAATQYAKFERWERE